MDRIVRLVASLALGLSTALAAAAEPDASPRTGADFMTLASTTSTENTGLLAYLIPIFRAKTGIDVRVVAVGTGQAIDLARRGDADALLVHDRESEDAFVRDGYGIERLDVMANDFVVVGPANDPVGIRGQKDVGRALVMIAKAKAPFVSRGDDSGTHKAELRLWRAAELDPRPESGSWYRELGRGMGGTLNTAQAMGAYTLSDRGTWLAFGNRSDLALLVEGDPRLENPYSAIVVDPKRHPHTKAAQAQQFVDWLVSEEGQAAIEGFRPTGETLFFPRARRSEAR